MFASLMTCNRFQPFNKEYLTTYKKFCVYSPELVISNIDIDVDIIDDTFDVSISTILSYKSIDRGIDDTLLAFFLSTLHRYFSTDTQVRNINEQDNKAQNKLALTVAFDKRN